MAKYKYYYAADEQVFLVLWEYYTNHIADITSYCNVNAVVVIVSFDIVDYFTN